MWANTHKQDKTITSIVSCVHQFTFTQVTHYALDPCLDWPIHNRDYSTLTFNMKIDPRPHLSIHCAGCWSWVSAAPVGEGHRSPSCACCLPPGKIFQLAPTHRSFLQLLRSVGMISSKTVTSFSFCATSFTAKQAGFVMSQTAIQNDLPTHLLIKIVYSASCNLPWWCKVNK